MRGGKHPQYSTGGASPYTQQILLAPAPNNPDEVGTRLPKHPMYVYMSISIQDSTTMAKTNHLFEFGGHLYGLLCTQDRRHKSYAFVLTVEFICLPMS